MIYYRRYSGEVVARSPRCLGRLPWASIITLVGSCRFEAVPRLPRRLLAEFACLDRLYKRRPAALQDILRFLACWRPFFASFFYVS